MAIRRPRMILPEFEPASGGISRRLFLRDVRVPRPFDFDSPPHLVAGYARTDQCPDGRHLWDAILATGDCRYDQDEREHLPFRLTLTCVRCGWIKRLAGVTDEEDCRGDARVPPEPLTAGDLLAQQVAEDGSVVLEWHVHDRDGVRVGFMCVGVTQRGRRYVQGWLERGGGGVEASTASACLRKLSKAAGDAG